jgi:hypothetical protein
MGIPPCAVQGAIIKMLQRVKIAFIIKPVREKDKRETMNEMKK